MIIGRHISTLNMQAERRVTKLRPCASKVVDYIEERTAWLWNGRISTGMSFLKIGNAPDEESR